MSFDGDALEGAGIPGLAIASPLKPVSGLYRWTAPPLSAQPIPAGLESSGAAEDAAPMPFPFRREDLRLDVDSHYAQNSASGTIHALKSAVLHWVARLRPAGPLTWAGPIWYKDGNAAGFQYTNVQIRVLRGPSPSAWPASATVTFSGAGLPPLVRAFAYKSRYLRKVEFEFDCAQSAAAALEIDTHAHPNHPATLPKERLTIQKVYQRAGFETATSSGTSVVPLNDAGGNAQWSDQEMHDAMQAYWSRFANKPQWALWTFFAGRHEMGRGLGGIMFDSIGPNHRQGTALFLDSFISQTPSGEPAATAAAWVRRMCFWTAVHEMGHAFNLAHAWQKSLGTPWIPLGNEPESRSFMNYPFRVAGGTPAFFADFEYRFSDQELLFMRHAPERFVQMGNADWFDHHGFQQDRVSAQPSFRLDLVPPRAGAKFEFLEPVVLDLRLTNILEGPQLIEGKILADTEHLTVIIKKQGRPAREHAPFARKCLDQAQRVIEPGKSIRDSIFLSAGLNGWDIAEPGLYTIQVALHLEGEDILSAPLILEVGRPENYEQDKLASSYFTEDSGRVLAFDGTNELTGGRDALRDLAERFPTTRAALHARIALGSPLVRRTRRLELGQAGEAGIRTVADLRGCIALSSADERQAREDLQWLVQDPHRADQTLGRVDFTYYVNRFQEVLDIERVLRDQAGSEDDLPEALADRLKSVSLGKSRKPAKKSAAP